MKWVSSTPTNVLLLHHRHGGGDSDGDDDMRLRNSKTSTDDRTWKKRQRNLCSVDRKPHTNLHRFYQNHSYGVADALLLYLLTALCSYTDSKSSEQQQNISPQNAESIATVKGHWMVWITKTKRIRKTEENMKTGENLLLYARMWGEESDMSGFHIVCV